MNKMIKILETEKGVEVFIDPEVTKISEGDIPNDAEILHIPVNSKLSSIERGALPKSILVPEDYEASHITRYRNSFYLGSEDNPYFLLLWARKAPIHKDCQLIYPHRRNHLYSREKNSENILGKFLCTLPSHLPGSQRPQRQPDTVQTLFSISSWAQGLAHARR